MLEDVLLSHPGVTDACVIGVPDAVAGELPMAFVVKAPGHTLTAQQVMDFVASKCMPRQFVVVICDHSKKIKN